MNDIFFSLNTDDIQRVASDELGRDLNINELEQIVDEINKRMDWYGPISEALNINFKIIVVRLKFSELL